MKKYGTLIQIAPDLLKEWHPTANKKLNPRNLEVVYPQKIWWLCNQGHGHSADFPWSDAQTSSLLLRESTQAFLRSIPSTSTGIYTSFFLDDGDYCIFGTNQDNTLEIGFLLVSKRHFLKTTWNPNTSGEFSYWISR